MKKIILSVAVATMALSTSALAVEDIKVSGQAKVWYETNNAGDNDFFSTSASTGEVVFKLGMTGKQGNVGFGAEMTQGSSMGLEGHMVSGVRTSANNLDNQTGTGDAYVSKLHFTAPIGLGTNLKMGRQELNTPFAFTEKWNAQQNNFDAAVAINSAMKNVTLIGAYVGQTNTAGNHKATQEFNQLFGGAYMVAGILDTDMIDASVWAYTLKNVGGHSAHAVWADAGMKIAMLNAKVYAAYMTANEAVFAEDTVAGALSLGAKVGPVKLFGAVSYVGGEDGKSLPVANTATNFKKTKLPTAAVYTDGKYVAMPETVAFKLKAAMKIASTGTGLVLQGVMNDGQADNDANEQLDATEIDLIIAQKVGDFKLKGIVMHRDWGQEGHDAQQHIRIIASINF